MKLKSLKTNLVLFLLFFGSANMQAAYNDCLLDVFYTELKEKNSEKVYNYFLNKSEEDCNKAYEAWKVLYQADENANRLHINNIETVLSFMVSTGKTVEEMVTNIKLVNGFEAWKNLEYQFQKEGMSYAPVVDIESDGTKEISHFLKDKNGEIHNCGESTLSPTGTLENVIFIPTDFRKKQVSKAIYNYLLTDEVKSILTEYLPEGKLVDNYNAFIKEYNISKDKVKAVLATPEGRVLGNSWKPIDIKFDKKGVNFSWIEIEDALSETKSWVIEEVLAYPDEVYKAVFQKDLEASEDLVKLFHENPEFIPSWQRLIDFPELRTDISVLKTYRNVKRIGNYSEEIIPVKTSELTKMHPAPKFGKEAEFLSLKNSFLEDGYLLSKSIQAVELPDGTKLVLDGNYRLHAMEELEQKVVPVSILSLDEAIITYGRRAYLKRLENLKKTGGSTNSLIENTEDLVKSLGEESIAVSIEVARLSGNYSGTYVQKISGSEISQEEVQALARLFIGQNFPSLSNK